MPSLANLSVEELYQFAKARIANGMYLGLKVCKGGIYNRNMTQEAEVATQIE